MNVHKLYKCLYTYQETVQINAPCTYQTGYTQNVSTDPILNAGLCKSQQQLCITIRSHMDINCSLKG